MEDEVDAEHGGRFQCLQSTHEQSKRHRAGAVPEVRRFAPDSRGGLFSGSTYMSSWIIDPHRFQADVGIYGATFWVTNNGDGSVVSIILKYERLVLTEPLPNRMVIEWYGRGYISVHSRFSKYIYLALKVFFLYLLGPQVYTEEIKKV